MNRTRAKQRADRIVRQATRKRSQELARQQFERDMAIVEGTLNAQQELINSPYARQGSQTLSDSP